jgi:hypothetical protein
MRSEKVTRANTHSLKSFDGQRELEYPCCNQAHSHFLSFFLPVVALLYFRVLRFPYYFIHARARAAFPACLGRHRNRHRHGGLAVCSVSHATSFIAIRDA